MTNRVTSIFSIPRRTTRYPLPTILLLVTLAGGCGDDETPATLLPVEAAEVLVNETLVLSLPVQNPSGLAVSYRYAGPSLPALDTTATLSGTPTGAEFRWTPLAAHVGTHQFDFTASTSAGDSTQSVAITVLPQVGTAPIFIQPGSGGTFDMSLSACVSFDLEVKDDDSTAVTIRAAHPLPAGATLDAVGNKGASFEWCPTDAQIATSLTWPMAFEADDGEHDPTPHRYTAVLRTAAGTDCPGEAPVITIDAPMNGQTVAQSGGYVVQVQVTDDVGIRDAPILYFRTTEPPLPLDPTGFVPISFVAGTTEDHWTATIPPLGITAGESSPVWFFVSASDNDDLVSTACDHRTDSPLVEFVAQGGSGGPRCGLCTTNEDCASGFCEAGGRCVDPCDGCETSCVNVTTTSGKSVGSCGGLAPCESAVDTCTPDAFDNHSPSQAVSLLGGPQNGSICDPGEIDWYSHLNGLEGVLTLTLADLDQHDLDLAAFDLSGNMIGIASTPDAVETVALCVPAGNEVHARVQSYQLAAVSWGSYSIAAAFEPGDCCSEEASEPNDTPEQAAPLTQDGAFSGSLCLLDHDIYAVEVAKPGPASISLSYQGTGYWDLSLRGPLPSNQPHALKFGSSGGATIQADLPAAGTYLLDLSTTGLEATGTYSGTVTTPGSAGCIFTYDCPVGTVCDEGTCVPNNCADPEHLCPSGHPCTPTGPGGDPICAFDCVIDAECRLEQGETCKWFEAGQRCGAFGTNPAGASCDTVGDCADTAVCHDWPGGYCAALGCTSNADCGPGQRCGTVNDLPICLVECVPDDDTCRESEGYGCIYEVDPDGELFNGCAPVISS